MHFRWVIQRGRSATLALPEFLNPMPKEVNTRLASDGPQDNKRHHFTHQAASSRETWTFHLTPVNLNHR